MIKVFLLTVTLTLISGLVWAANPADLTSNHRSFPSEFYKLAWDGGQRWVCANEPLKANVNVTLFNWQDKRGDPGFTQLILAKKLFSWLDGAVDAILADQASHNALFDIHNDKFGLGIAVSLQSDEEIGLDIQLGPRLEIKGLSGFATLSRDSKPLWGISRSIIKGLKAEVAYGNRIWFIRASREFQTSFGSLFPELRNKLSKDEKCFGLALGFMPN